MTVGNHLPPPAPPAIGVILPTLGRVLVPTFACLAAQTHRDFCVIVIDQNPVAQWHPGTPEFRDLGVQEFTPILDGPRGVLLHAPWLRGSSTARNLGIVVAQQLGCRGLVFIDDDDTFDPDYLACLWALSEAHPEAETVACDVVLSNGTTLRRDHYHTSSRLWRMDRASTCRACGHIEEPHVFDDLGPAQDHRFWQTFAPFAPPYCGHAHYQCGDAPVGGLRDASGRF